MDSNNSLYEPIWGHDVYRCVPESPRGIRYTVGTKDELIIVLRYRAGMTTAGRGLRRGSTAEPMNADGRMARVRDFSFIVGEVGWVKWAAPDDWVGDGFVTKSPVERIHVMVLPRYLQSDKQED